MAIIYDKNGINAAQVVSGSDNINRLTTETTIVGGLAGATGIWKWEKIANDQNISSEEYTKIMEITSSNSGFYGIIFKTNTDQLDFKIDLDEEEILNLHLKNDLKTNFDLGFSNNIQGKSVPWIREYSSNRFRFEPPEGFYVSSSLKLYLKADSINKKIENGLFIWRKLK